MFQARGRSSITGHRPGTSGEPELPGHEGISRHYRYNCLQINKDVVKHKSAKLLMTYAVGELEAALNVSHLILSTSSQRVS